MKPTSREAKRYKMVLSYDGTDYAGWQIQPNGTTIQKELQFAIERLTGEKTIIHGSGRTDQGVHARRQVAHFDLQHSPGAVTLRKGLNALLPPDIRILTVSETHPLFHARRSATSKEYRYFIWNAEVMSPVYRHYRTHVRNRLDVGMMREAAQHLVGRHDFAAFTANPNREVETTLRHLSQLKVVKRGPEIVIIARADGFLYRMVRSIAGFLIRVGEGSISPSMTSGILSSRTRTATVPTAAPQGLFLWNVTY